MNPLIAIGAWMFSQFLFSVWLGSCNLCFWISFFHYFFHGYLCILANCLALFPLLYESQIHRGYISSERLSMTLDQMNFLVFPMEMPWFGCPFPPLKMYFKKKKNHQKGCWFQSELDLFWLGLHGSMYVCMYVCVSFLSIPKRMSILKTLVCGLPKLTL